MEDYLIKPPKFNVFVRILFYLLSSVIMMVLLLLYFLEVNDSVKVSDGELFTKNAPVEFKAPHDGFIKKVWVREGDKVTFGDTLVLIENDALRSEYAKVKEQYFLEQINLNLIHKELINKERQLKELGKQKNLSYSKNNFNKKNTSIELKMLEDKIKFLSEKLALGESRLEKDFKLYKDGALSQIEYENNRRNHLDELNELGEAKKEYQLKLSARKGNKNQFSENIQRINTAWIILDQEIIEYKRKIFVKESEIQNLAVQMEFLGKSIKQLVIKSNMDGNVISLFNERQNTTLIEKGKTLCLIKPKDAEEFYARLQIPSTAVAKIKPGQTVHLKLDTYNYYQFGILKAEVQNVSIKDTTSQFYLLAKISDVPPQITLQSGFQLKGDVVLEKYKLYRFVLNAIFGIAEKA